MGARASAGPFIIPFICHLFHHPRPQVLPDGRTRWACSCGAVWVE
jgi:hypothetical protein